MNDLDTDRICENCYRDWRGAATCPICGFENDVLDAKGRSIAPPQAEIAPRPAGNWDTNEAPIKVVCCYCTPWHTMREGAEPASHGACPAGVERFERGL